MPHSSPRLTKRSLLRALTLFLALTGVVALSSLPVHAATGTWVPIGPSGGLLFSIGLDPLRPATLLAGGEAGVFRTDNGGTSWSLNPDTSVGDAFQILFDPTDANRVYLATNVGVFRSEDGGTTWIAASSGLPLSPSVVVSAIAIEPNVSRTLYAAVGSRVYKTVNHGRAWFVSSGGLPKRAFISALAVDPNSPATIYAGTTLGVFKSLDGGVSWSPARAGLGLATVTDLVIDPVGRGRIYAAVQGNDETPAAGVFVSRNAGATWTAAAPLPASAPGAFCVAVSARVLYACANNGIAKSVDGGQNWTAVNDGLGSGATIPSFSSIATDPTNPDHLYAASSDLGNGGAAVVETTSGGEQWHEATQGITAVEVLALATETGHAETLYAGTADGGLYATTDGGASWTRGPGVTGTVNSIVVAPSAAYAATDTGVFASTDNGASWTLRNPTVSGPLLLDPQAPAQLYGFGFSGSAPSLDFFSSQDGGSTLTPIGPVSGVAVTSAALAVSTPRTIYAAVLSTTPFFSFSTALNVSQDGGATFRPVTSAVRSVTSVTADPFEPGTAYYVGAGTITGGIGFSTLYRAQSFGATVVPVHDQAVAAVVDPVVPGKVYVATRTGFEVSFDSGSTWTVLADTVPGAGITGLALGADGTVYAATDGASVYKLAVPLP
jgi:hypothetical protein